MGSFAVLRYGCLIFAMATIVLMPCFGAAATDAPVDLEAFRSKFRCDVLERLAYIHMHGDRAGPDRFIVVAVEGYPQAYVQCIFIDGDTKMLCEASSGYFAQLPGKQRRFRIKPRGVHILEELGFSIDDSDGNYQRMVELGRPADLLAIADLILTTLYRVYGAEHATALEFKAPLAPDSAPSLARCTGSA
jgi:hypothetical protein